MREDTGKKPAKRKDTGKKRGKRKRSEARIIADKNLSKIFGDRLSSLLNKHYGKEEIEAEKAFIVLKKIDPDKAHDCITSLDKADATRKIISWMHGKVMPGSISILLDICDLLDCEPGYLLGTQEEYHRGIIHSAQEIGLNDKSIMFIKNYPTEIKKLLDDLILHSKGDNLLKLLQAIQIYALQSHCVNVHLEVPGLNSHEKTFERLEIEDKLIGATPEKGNTLPDISKKMLKYAATSTLDEILANIYTDYIEEWNKLLKERLDKEADLKKKRISHLIEERKWHELTPDDNLFLWQYCSDGSLEDAFAKIDDESNRKYNELKNR